MKTLAKVGVLVVSMCLVLPPAGLNARRRRIRMGEAFQQEVRRLPPGRGTSSSRHGRSQEGHGCPTVSRRRDIIGRCEPGARMTRFDAKTISDKDARGDRAVHPPEPINNRGARTGACPDSAVSPSSGHRRSRDGDGSRSERGVRRAGDPAQVDHAAKGRRRHGLRQPAGSGSSVERVVTGGLLPDRRSPHSGISSFLSRTGKSFFHEENAISVPRRNVSPIMPWVQDHELGPGGALFARQGGPLRPPPSVPSRERDLSGKRRS